MRPVWVAGFVAVALVGSSGCETLGEVARKDAATPPGGIVPTRVQARRMHVRAHLRLESPGPLEIGGRQRSDPAYDPERDWLFVGTKGGFVHALRGQDLSGRWVRDLGGSIDAPLLLTREHLYVASARGRLFALDPATGKTLWDRNLGVELGLPMILTDGRLIVPSLGDTVSVLDSGSGETIWQHRNPSGSKLAVRGSAQPAVAGDLVLVAFSDGTVAALGLGDGKELWSQRHTTSAPFDDIDAGLVVRGTRVFLATFAGRVLGLSLATGQVAWEAKGRVQGATHLSFVGDTLLLLTSGEAVALGASDGEVRWRTRLGEGDPTAATQARDTVAVGSSAGSLYCLSRRSGRPLAFFAPGSGISAAAVPAREGLWVFSNGGTIYRVDP